MTTDATDWTWTRYRRGPIMTDPKPSDEKAAECVDAFKRLGEGAEELGKYLNVDAQKRPDDGGRPADMTLRDYFAAKAMQGLMEEYDGDNSEWLTTESYRIADGMLIARK